MMIEKLNATNPIANIQKGTKLRDSSELNTKDSVTLSSDATRLAEFHLAMNAIKATSDIRLEKVAEMQAIFAAPSYVNGVIDKVADVLAEMYKL